MLLYWRQHPFFRGRSTRPERSLCSTAGTSPYYSLTNDDSLKIIANVKSWTRQSAILLPYFISQILSVKGQREKSTSSRQDLMDDGDKSLRFDHRLHEESRHYESRLLAGARELLFPIIPERGCRHQKHCATACSSRKAVDRVLYW